MHITFDPDDLVPENIAYSRNTHRGRMFTAGCGNEHLEVT